MGKGPSLSVIAKLPEELINQIKAGEVIERPASVVKELLENALDAEATLVQLELLDAGKELIRIKDNGRGMSPDDLPLCIQRHATSKLKSFEDLQNIASFGFRGEALPSVAAISRMSIKSRQEGKEFGNSLNIDNGKLGPIEECTCPQGTEIAVRDLFYTVPARRKFLKSTATELAHIQEYVTALALSYPSVGIKLVHNSRTLINCQPAENIEERMRQLRPHSELPFYPIQFSRGSFHITGLLGCPNHARKVPQIFVSTVNGRIVKDKVIRSAVLMGYEGLVMKGCVPSACVFVSVKPNWVDVNAHPAKTELRFTDTALIQEYISQAVAQALKEALSQSATPKQPEAVLTAPIPEREPETEPNTSYQTAETPKPKASFKLPSQARPAPAFEKPQFSRTAQLGTRPALEAEERIPKTPKLAFKEEYKEQEEPQFSFTTPLEGPFQQAQFLGQFNKLYLLLQVQEELWVVDQHAFHERILYEEFMRAEQAKTYPKQELLTPEIISLPPQVDGVVEEYRTEIEELGFDFEVLANDTLSITAFPAVLRIDKIAQTFDEILCRLMALEGLEQSEVHPLLARIDAQKKELHTLGLNKKSLEKKSLFRMIYATMACHSSLRGGDVLSTEAVHRLLNRAGDVDFFAHCPHGRPVIRRFNAKDIDSWFMRIV